MMDCEGTSGAAAEPAAEFPRWKKTWSGGALSSDHLLVGDVSDTVIQSFAGAEEVTEDQLSQLAFLHGHTTLLSALDLVDRRAVTVYTSPSAPPVYTVLGSQSKEYLCLPSTNFCDCEAYRYKVLKADQLMCKHVLAVRIAVAANMVTATQVDDSSVPELVCGSLASVT
eukprot:m.470945 g.470945  ORF g.470945 m.470945 type:complete len:169 (+) comp30436_c0_seq1:203-709(+)